MAVTVPEPSRQNIAVLPPTVAAVVWGVRRARAERRGLRIDRRTWALGAVALGTTGAVAAFELGRVWRRGSAPHPTETNDVIGAADVAARETVEVAKVGYQQGSTRENALLNLHLSFTLTFGIARLLTHVIRRRGRVGPIRNYRWGGRHIHHFVPGIVLAFLSGAVSIVSRNQRLDPWLALPFGAGLALTLDESALLLELDDVYWTERGVMSLQITLGTLALLSSLALAVRVLRRGEAEVLDGEEAA